MQPLQYHLRCPAAKDNTITHATAAPGTLDEAITVRSAAIELQKTREQRNLKVEDVETKLLCETSLKN